MRRLLLLMLLALPARAAEPVDALVDQARAAYNGAQYEQAARLFLQAAQIAPERVELYRDLARARLWAHDAPGAVTAYRVYLAAAGQAEDHDKVQAELDLALRQVPPDAPTGVPDAAAKALAAARARAVDGKFAGPDGAFAALDAAVTAGFLGPELGEARRAVADELTRQTGVAVDRWWKPDQRLQPEALAPLAAGWDALAARGPLNPAQGTSRAAVTGLDRLLRGDAKGAIDTLVPVAGDDPRLRYAVAIALVRTKRLDEAADSAQAAAAALDDPRPHLLLGLLRNRAGQDGAAELRRGLDLEEEP
jgi:hypothetical protein